jgi:hypothetical protein
MFWKKIDNFFLITKNCEKFCTNWKKKFDNKFSKNYTIFSICQYLFAKHFKHFLGSNAVLTKQMLPLWKAPVWDLGSTQQKLSQNGNW